MYTNLFDIYLIQRSLKIEKHKNFQDYPPPPPPQKSLGLPPDKESGPVLDYLFFEQNAS